MLDNTERASRTTWREVRLVVRCFNWHFASTPLLTGEHYLSDHTFCYALLLGSRERGCVVYEVVVNNCTVLHSQCYRLLSSGRHASLNIKFLVMFDLMSALTTDYQPFKCTKVQPKWQWDVLLCNPSYKRWGCVCGAVIAWIRSDKPCIMTTCWCLKFPSARVQPFNVIGGKTSRVFSLSVGGV